MFQQQSLLFLGLLLLVQAFASTTIPLLKRVSTDKQNAKATTVGDELKTVLDSYQYYTEIRVGSQDQKFNMTFTTADQSIYILSANSSGDCKTHVSFNSSTSTTFKNTTVKIANKQYEKVSVGNDTVGFGKLIASNQPIALFELKSCPVMLTSGSVGLGFTVQNQLPTFIDSLYNQGIIKEKVVGFHLNRNWKSRIGGEISIGELNTNLYSSVKYIKATPSVPYWSITLDSVRFGDEKIDSNNEAIISSSVGPILLPEKKFEAIRKMMKGTVFVNGVLLIPETLIDKLPDLVFTIGGSNYTLSPSDYVDKENEYQALHAILLFSNKNTKWEIGSAFLGKYYTTLNYEKREIGFADYKAGVSRSQLFVPLLLITFLVNKLN